MLEQGLIQVYTGSSDSFNFAPLGLALRAAGHGLRTKVTCFANHELFEGDRTASSLLKPNLVIDHAAPGPNPPTSGNRVDDALRAFQLSREAVLNGEFDIVVLNGIQELLCQDVIPLGELLALMDEKPINVELVLAGFEANQTIIDKADLVTEMVVHNPARFPQVGNCPVYEGTVEVVTGNGKGKTTYCLGKGMLASCTGIPTLILQFIKSPRMYGEVRAIEKLPYLEIKTMGKGFLIKHSPFLEKKHKKAAREAWELWLKQISSEDYGLLILDEINIATDYGLISGGRVREALFLGPHKYNILMSGRNAHPEVIEASKTVIEMKEIKHPFRKGVKARKGIEY